MRLLTYRRISGHPSRIWDYFNPRGPTLAAFSVQNRQHFNYIIPSWEIQQRTLLFLNLKITQREALSGYYPLAGMVNRLIA
jgi:hypothetical protein